MNKLTTTLAVYSEFAGVVAVAIQVTRTARSKNTRGLSVIKNTLMTSSMVGWFVFGITINIWPVYVANGLMLPMMVYLLYMLARNNQRKLVFTAAGVCGLILAAVLLLAPPVFAGWIAVIFMTCALSPQLYKAIKDKKIDGISRNAEYVWLSVGVTTFWYAYILRVMPLVLAGVFGTLYSCCILYLVQRKHPRHKS